jgi:hypothetical protein
MSLITHVAVLGLLIVDLLVGSVVIGGFLNRGAATGFEFVLILGYIAFVLQWGVPWGRREGDDR